MSGPPPAPAPLPPTRPPVPPPHRSWLASALPRSLAPSSPRLRTTRAVLQPPRRPARLTEAGGSRTEGFPSQLREPAARRCLAYRAHVAAAFVSQRIVAPPHRQRCPAALRAVP